MRRPTKSAFGFAVLHRMQVRSRAGVLRREAGVVMRGISEEAAVVAVVGGREM
jgi:hypothetical protein